MPALCALLAEVGMRDSRSLLASGNVVFRSDLRSASKIESVLEKAAAQRLGVATEFFVRAASEWTAIIAGNPFPREATRDPGHLLVMCLKEAPERAAVDALQKAVVGRELVRAKGREAYIVYPDGIGRSRLTIAIIERMLGTRATGRNWNTVIKLDAMATPR
jgi:uncharacterized protein (DUF1697 family)